MGLFGCKHSYVLKSKSNVLDVNNFGAVTRLCQFECEKCGKVVHEWCDVAVTTVREVDSGKSILVEWMTVDNEGS